MSRIETLKKMIADNPKDPRPRFGLALEYERARRWTAVVDELKEYLKLAGSDEGNAYGRLAHALRELGRDDEARDVLEKGIQAAYRANHPSMAMEFEDILLDMG